MSKKTKYYYHGVFLILALSLTSLLLGSCTKRGVIVTKGAPEEREGYQGGILLGNADGSRIYNELCTRDLARIISMASLDPDEAQQLSEAICGSNPSPAKAKAFYDALPDSKRVDLFKSFEFYGYHINGYG